MICFEKSNFLIFFYIFSRDFGGVNFDFMKVLKIFWPQWDLANVVRNKVMKNELIWSINRRSIRDHLHGWAQFAPPRVE